jgi:hypothetical protein
VHVNAHGAAVDLTGAQVHEIDRRLRQACLARRRPERLEGVEDPGQADGGVC